MNGERRRRRQFSAEKSPTVKTPLSRFGRRRMRQKRSGKGLAKSKLASRRMRVGGTSMLIEFRADGRPWMEKLAARRTGKSFTGKMQTPQTM